MADKVMDRRIARTRGTLQRALSSLILTKGYDAITVDDICETANVGRSTFYSHFTSKDDLKRRGLDEHLRELLADRRRNAPAPGDLKDRHLAFSLPLFEHARDHLDLYRALAGSRGGGVSLGAIRQIVSDLVREEIADNADRNPGDVIPRDVVVTYVVGAYMALLTWWLDGGAKLPPQRMDGMFRQLATEGIMPPDSEER
ncbi:TetR/AcrR family transcriptional regulator [Mesorhizobium sp. M7A.F.Ca.US.008.03.1.1]|uniref:TetR/AcrR family transcriptional regulator n=1 Tax=Mesorhizobium sp. M7A.F.Ca.US.008.03.1.1 TaxID=2496742 RepID=UPI001FE0C85A|nr:TetR/AcrR family transcriptional regulator [Mesorhizobium sp. M7A.F.Ca.US.008.03.1.1]